MAHKLKLKPRLAKRLSELGKSQEWLAKQLGVGPSYISRVARGTVTPKVSTAYVMAGLLQCSIEDLWLVE